MPCPVESGSSCIRPPVTGGTPSNSSGSSRAWSTNRSTCRRLGTAAATGACSAGAQCPEISRPWAAASAAPRSHSVVAGAAGHVELQAVQDRAQPPGVEDAGGVLPCRHVAAHDRPDHGEGLEVVAADRLLEPGDAELVVLLTHGLGLADGVAAVGVDHHLHVAADDLAHQPGALKVPPGPGTPRLAHLDLDHLAPGSQPSLDLRAQLGVGQRGEAAAAVDRDGVTGLAEHCRQRQAEQPGLEVPQCDVAAIACEVGPPRPRLRVARTIASHAPGTSIGSRPRATPARCSSIRAAVEALV